MNVLVPFAPVLIIAFVDLLIGITPSDWARCEAILVYTFVLPVLYLENARGPAGTTFFWMTSVAGVILYVVLHTMTHLAPQHDTTIIYRVALGLDIVYVGVATLYELGKTVKGDRVVQ
jgi:hypothetical protein